MQAGHPDADPAGAIVDAAHAGRKATRVGRLHDAEHAGDRVGRGIAVRGRGRGALYRRGADRAEGGLVTGVGDVDDRRVGRRVPHEHERHLEREDVADEVKAGAGGVGARRPAALLALARPGCPATLSGPGCPAARSAPARPCPGVALRPRIALRPGRRGLGDEPEPPLPGPALPRDAQRAALSGAGGERGAGPRGRSSRRWCCLRRRGRRQRRGRREAQEGKSSVHFLLLSVGGPTLLPTVRRASSTGSFHAA